MGRSKTFTDLADDGLIRRATRHIGSSKSYETYFSEGQSYIKKTPSDNELAGAFLYRFCLGKELSPKAFQQGEDYFIAEISNWHRWSDLVRPRAWRLTNREPYLVDGSSILDNNDRVINKPVRGIGSHVVLGLVLANTDLHSGNFGLQERENEFVFFTIDFGNCLQYEKVERLTSWKSSTILTSVPPGYVSTMDESSGSSDESSGSSGGSSLSSENNWDLHKVCAFAHRPTVIKEMREMIKNLKYLLSSGQLRLAVREFNVKAKGQGLQEIKIEEVIRDMSKRLYELEFVMKSVQ